jgi:hypothetical protein
MNRGKRSAISGQPKVEMQDAPTARLSVSP